MSFRRAQISTPLFVLVVLASTVTAKADHKEWLKFFAGKWSDEGRMWTEADGWKKVSAVREIELMVNGNAVLDRRTGTNGDTTIVLMGWDPARKLLVETAYFSVGLAATITYDTISQDSMSGDCLVGAPDGNSGKGRVTIHRKDENSFTGEWEVKMSSGEIIKGEGITSRR